MKKNKAVKIVIILLLFAIVGFVIWYKFSEHYSISDRSEKIKKEAAKGEYPVIGWVRVQGTNIDYPVIYALDGTVDIDNIDPEYSFAWKNYYDLDKLNRKVLLGHNIRNVSSHPLINEKTFNNFENLPSFLYYDFVKDNKYIQYTDEKGNNYLYKIYAVYLQDGQDNNGLEEMNKKEKEKFIYTFFPFMIGIYPYAVVTDKKREAMKQANLHYEYYSLYEIANMGIKKMLGV